MASRTNVINLLRTVGAASCSCPAHSTVYSVGGGGGRFNATKAQSDKDYAFEAASSSIRYGPGVTQEVGMDLANMKAKNVGLYTDKNVAGLPPVKAALDSMTKAGVNFSVYDNVRVEPTDQSFLEASKFAKENNFDAFVAVGGGSVMDTCKAANLLSSHPDAELFDFVAPPTGKGKAVWNPLKPLIAIPTTSGTGSETTGIAVFDFVEKRAKFGIANRAIRPSLGIIDPLHALHMPERVAAFSGFDVLCHALESFTAINYTERPRPENPQLRPTYQGSNPVADVWSRETLRVLNKYFERSVFNKDDERARAEMHLAATYAGTGIGSAGVHLCHGLSYSISGMVKSYKPEHYNEEYPIIPHGLSVVMTAPAVFSFTASMCPERHLEAASILGGRDVSKDHREDAGKILADIVRGYMQRLKIPDGLNSLGYGKDDLHGLVEGALPQERVNKLAPRAQTAEDLASIYENSFTVY